MTGRAACLAGMLPLLGMAWLPALGQGVYIAGERFTLDEAVRQARAERNADEPFWVVATDDVANRIAEGDPASHRLLEQIREQGGLLYVCSRGLREDAVASLPPDIGIIGPAAGRMPSTSGSSESGEEGAPGEISPPRVPTRPVLPEPDAQRRLMLRACSALE